MRQTLRITVPPELMKRCRGGRRLQVVLEFDEKGNIWPSIEIEGSVAKKPRPERGEVPGFLRQRK